MTIEFKFEVGQKVKAEGTASYECPMRVMERIYGESEGGVSIRYLCRTSTTTLAWFMESELRLITTPVKEDR